MPSSGSPVYQPTTVSYEPARPSGLLGTGSPMSVEVPLRVFRKPRPQVALLLFGLIALAAGVAMLASGSADLFEAEEYVGEHLGNDISGRVELPLGLLLGGVFMICLGFVAIGVYLKVADWRRNCICPCPFFEKKQSLARQLQCQTTSVCNQGINALNPSTDPLVSHTQYSAVSELPRIDDEERRNLMPDSKDCVSSAEESDRMLDPDPRILLRPMGRVEDA